MRWRRAARITLVAITLLLLSPLLALAQKTRVYGFCEVGGQKVITQGLTQISPPSVMGSYGASPISPPCVVTVYETGTLTLASIFSNQGGTGLANPFSSSNSQSYWFFYATPGDRVDVVISSGGLPAPFTFSDILAGGAASTPLLLQTNGVTNSSQVLLNLAAGSGITLANSAGTTTISSTGGGGGGSVTSVAETVPPELTISGSPITSSGTLAIDKSLELPNTFWAGPINTSSSNIVQVAKSSCDGCSPATVSLTVTPGDLLIALISQRTRTAPTDNVGDTFSFALTNNNDVDTSIYYVCSAIGGPTTVSQVTQSGYSAHLHVIEVSGAASSSCLDTDGTTGQTIGHGPAVNALTVTTGGTVNQPAELVVAAFNSAQSTCKVITPGLGYSQLAETFTTSGVEANWPFMSEVLNTQSGLSGTQTATAACNLGGALSYNNLIATFRLSTVNTSQKPVFRAFNQQDWFNAFLVGGSITLGGGYTWDFSSSGHLLARVAAGLTTSLNGDIGYDTTLSMWHGWMNGVDSLYAMVPVSTSITNGDCANWSKVAGTITLGDAGSACGSGSATAFSALSSGTNTSAAMVVGSGASLAISGTGSIQATKLSPAGASGNCAQWGTSGAIGDSGAPCAPGGTVTSIATTAPLSGGAITTTGTLSCPTCVVASSPGAGIAHFAGSTQTVTSSAVSLTADVTGTLAIAHGGTSTTGNPIKRLLAPWGVCNATVSGSSWNIPASGGAVSSCPTPPASGLVYYTLQFANSALAYDSLLLPADWQSFSTATIWFTSSDTTTGHTIVFQLATVCVAPNTRAPIAPSFNAAQSFSTVTIPSTPVSGETFSATLSSITSTGCAAGDLLYLAFNRSASDTSTDTGIGLVGALELDYNGTYQ